MARPKLSPFQAIQRAVPIGSKILVAVSGGRDSILLLHCACKLRGKLKLTVEAAHVDHGLRAASRSDAEFVSEQCRKLDLRLHLKRVAPPKSANTNVEAWGRKTRYDFFRSILRKRNLDFVLTAHNADDVAETLLMRLFSNKELGSIKSIESGLMARRPFLELSREAINEFVDSERLRFVEDETNSDPRYLRNWVRHVIMPVLHKDVNSRASEALSRRAAYLAQDQEFLYELAGKQLAELQLFQFGSGKWLKELRNKLEGLKDPLQWRFIELLFKPLLGFNLGREHSARVAAFLLGNGATLELPSKVKLNRKSGQIRVMGCKVNHFEYL